MTDHCVKMALSDAFGRVHYNRTPPAPFAFARWGPPCHFKRSGGDKWVHYTNAEYGCHREFCLNLARFRRWEPLSQWPLGNPVQGNLASMVGHGHRKPAKSGVSDAVSTGNSLCEREIQRRREILRFKSRSLRHYPLRLVVTWALPHKLDPSVYFV